MEYGVWRSRERIEACLPPACRQTVEAGDIIVDKMSNLRTRALKERHNNYS